MNDKKFLLEIVTPERIAISWEVEAVSVPSEMGRLGILAGHAPVFANLVEGEVKIKKGGEDYFLSIGGGFLQTTPKKTSILVTKAVHADELNEQAILKAKERAEKALKQKPEGEEFRAAQALLRSTLVDLKVLRRRKKYQAGIRPKEL